MNGNPRDSAQDQNEMITTAPALGNREVAQGGNFDAHRERPKFYDSAHWWWPYWNDWSTDDTHAHVSVR